MNNDDWGMDLKNQGMEDARDRYLQSVIDFLDDPDYEGVPILLDGDNIIYPKGANLVSIIKALKSTKKWFQDILFKEDEE